MDMDLIAAAARLVAAVAAVVGAVDWRSRVRAQHDLPRTAERPVQAIDGTSTDAPVKMTAMQTIVPEPSEALECLRRVRRRLVALGAQPAEAQDAAQHALLKACEKADGAGGQGAPIDNLQAWMWRVALNHYRTQVRRRETAIGAEADIAVPGLPHDEQIVQSLYVEDVLKPLVPDARAVVIGRMYGISYERIAEALHIEPAEAREHMRTARRHLRGPLTPRTRRPGPASVVARSEAVEAELLAHGGDLRTMSPDDRREVAADVAEMQHLMLGCRAGRFDKEQSRIVLRRVAAVAAALIADRDEETALRFTQAASPHLRFWRAPSTEAFQLRRVLAEAFSELGNAQRAEKLLRRLSEDERQRDEGADPRTNLLLHWALIGQDRLLDAESGFNALTSSLTTSSLSEVLRLHVQCRYAWLLGRLGRVEESVGAYTGVVRDRTRVLGKDHPDTLDARHSLGKTLARTGYGERAFAWLDRLPDTRARVQGGRHSDTLESSKYRSIARLQIEPRDDRAVTGALDNLAEILDMQVVRHGVNHAMSRDTDQWINWIRGVSTANRFHDPLPPLPRA